MKKEPLVYNFEGIDIPYFPSVTKTVITPEGETEVPQVPIFISRLKRYEKTKHVDDLIPACESLLREAINEANRANYVWYHGFMCRVVVSASCPDDTIYLDEVNGQVCGNEDFFYNKYWDADGDMMMVSKIKMRYGYKGVTMKHPLHDAAKCSFDIGRIDMILLPETFYDFGKKEAVEFLKNNPLTVTSQKWKQDFIRFNATYANVGGITTRYTVEELRMGESGKTYNEKIYYLANGVRGESERTLRSQEIEAGLSLKLGNLTDELPQDASKETLASPYNFFLTSNNRTERFYAPVLGTLLGRNLSDIIKDVNELNLEYRGIKGQDKDDEGDSWYELESHDDHFIARMQQLGIIHTEVIPSANDFLREHNYNPVVIHLRNMNNDPCALTGIKNEGKAKGLTYAYAFYPIFDSTTGTVLTPMEMLAKEASAHFDSILRAYKDGELVEFSREKYWPRSKEDLLKYPVKTAMFEDWITDYIQRFGDCVPATLEERKGKIYPKVTEVAREVISETFSIHYRGATTPEMKWAIWKDCRHLFRITESTEKVFINLNPGTKSKGPVKHYLFQKRGLNSRAGKNRSQVLQGIKIPPLRVAVVHSATLQQSWITPSGIKKQEIKKLFFPQTFNTRGDLDEYIESNALLNVEKGDIKTTIISSLTGEKTKIWLLTPKEPAPIGKLIDAQNRTEPRAVPQFWTVKNDQKQEIDLLMSVNELSAKQMHFEWLDLDEMEEMTLSYPPEWTPVTGEKTFKAMVGEIEMYRSGTASENVKGCWRTARQQGAFGHIIWNIFNLAGLKDHAIRQGVLGRTKEPNLEYAQQLKDIAEQIIAMHGLEYAFSDVN